MTNARRPLKVLAERCCALLCAGLLSSGICIADPANRVIEDLQKRADSGDTGAINELGWAYANGEGVNRDEAAAFACFRKSAEAGDPAGMLATAVRYRAGLGVPFNAMRADEWSRKALAVNETHAQSGDMQAMVALSAMLFRGIGTTRDESRACLWTVKAAEKGDIKGMTFAALLLADHPDEKKREQALRWALTAAEAGESAAMFAAAAIYDAGLTGPRNETKARQWYRKSADAGDVDAMIFMALKADADKDDVEAFKWLAKVAKARNVWAISELGMRYLKGRGAAKDDVRGEDLMRQAAYLGDARDEQSWACLRRGARRRRTGRRGSYPLVSSSRRSRRRGRNQQSRLHVRKRPRRAG